MTAQEQHFIPIRIRRLAEFLPQALFIIFGALYERAVDECGGKIPTMISEVTWKIETPCIFLTRLQ